MQCHIHSQLRNSMSKFVVLFVVLVVCFSASKVQSAPKNIHVHLYNMRKFFAGATASETDTPTGKEEHDINNVNAGTGNVGQNKNNANSNWGNRNSNSWDW